MNIAVITQHYYPDNFRVNEIVEELVKKGHKVKVITGLPDYTTSNIPKEYRFFKKRFENINGATVIRVPTIARRSGVFFRAFNYASFVVSGFIYASFCKCKDIDSVLVYQTSPVFQAIPAIWLKNRAKCKLMLYCCDLWPESLKAWNISEKSFIFQSVKKLSKRIYRACDMISITSSTFRDYLQSVCNVKSTKIQYLPQHAEDLYQEIHSRYVENNCVDFMFAGNIGSVQNVDCIIKAIPHIQTQTKFHIHIVGDGSELKACKSLAKSLQVEDRITFHGRHPLEKMKDFYAMADCFLLTLRGGDFIGMTLPAKSQSYISCGKPVIGAIDGAGKQMIMESDCGLWGQAGDHIKLAENMTTMIENLDFYKQKGTNGRVFYERNFKKEIFMQRLLNLL